MADEDKARLAKTCLTALRTLRVRRTRPALAVHAALAQLVSGALLTNLLLRVEPFPALALKAVARLVSVKVGRTWRIRHRVQTSGAAKSNHLLTVTRHATAHEPVLEQSRRAWQTFRAPDLAIADKSWRAVHTLRNGAVVDLKTPALALPLALHALDTRAPAALTFGGAQHRKSEPRAACTLERVCSIGKGGLGTLATAGATREGAVGVVCPPAPKVGCNRRAEIVAALVALGQSGGQRDISAGRAGDALGRAGDGDGSRGAALALGGGGGSRLVTKCVWLAGLAQVDALGALEDVEGASGARDAGRGVGVWLVGAGGAFFALCGCGEGAGRAGGGSVDDGCGEEGEEGEEEEREFGQWEQGVVQHG